MRQILKLLPIFVTVFALTVSPTLAEERYLDALGRIQTRYDSLDELKPLLALTASSLTEWPGADSWLQASDFGLQEWLSMLSPEAGSLTPDALFPPEARSLMSEALQSETFHLRLFLGRDAIYPVLLFPTKSEHTIPNQRLALKKLVVPYSGGREIGFVECCWGAHGHWGYVTTPQLGELIERSLADGTFASQGDAANGNAANGNHGDAANGDHDNTLELATLTLYLENLPQGPLQIGDVLVTSYWDYVYAVMIGVTDFDWDSNSNTHDEYLGILSTINLYSAIIKDLRAICEGVRQFSVQAALDRETGDLLLAATTEYKPHSDLARQNQMRRDHRQTLAEFYQPDDAILAFAEGVAPRLEEKSFLASAVRSYFGSLSYDRDPDDPIHDLYENMFEKTLFPSLLADWQEVAVTVDGDASILAAFHVTGGQYVAELFDALVETVNEDEREINDNPAEFHVPETYKGYRIFSATMPIPEEQRQFGKFSKSGVDYTLSWSNQREESMENEAGEQDDHGETQISESDLKARKRAEWLDGKSVSYCLAVSDDVAAIAAGLTPVDATLKLKDAIDRNTVAREQSLHQHFPETTLVFATPTPEQLRTLAAMFNDDTWWQADESSGEVSTSTSDGNDGDNGDGDNDSGELTFQLTKQIKIRSKYNPADSSPGKIHIRSTLTDTSRTDQVRISEKFLEW